MGKRGKRGASRKPIRKERPLLVWQQLLRHSVLVLVVGGIIAVGVYVQQSDILPIKHVTVEGVFVHINRETFVATVSPYSQGSFMRIDVSSIREAGEALPWVKQIQVRRIWPDRLHFIVEEHVVVAQWGETGLLTSEGNVFFPPKNTFPGRLAVLVGPDNSQASMVQRYQKMDKALQNEGLRITSLVMDDRRSWSIKLDNGMKVLLGRTASEQRFQRFMRVYRSEFRRYTTQVSEMDMRYTNGLSVVWKQGKKPDFNKAV